MKLETDAADVPVAGLVWAAAAPVWTGTQTSVAAVFGHRKSRSLQGTPPTEAVRVLDLQGFGFCYFLYLDLQEIWIPHRHTHLEEELLFKRNTQ